VPLRARSGEVLQVVRDRIKEFSGEGDGAHPGRGFRRLVEEPTVLQADRWVAVALRTISPALDPDASDEAWEWLYDGRIDTRRALLRMEPCTVSVTHASTRITWTIRPVVFLPLAHRQGVELPAWAYDFTAHATVSSPR
jgi:hypothetical protein